VRQQRDVSGFRRVSFRSFGELIIRQGESESLEIEADEDALARTATEVRGDTLHIEIDRAWKWFFVPPQRIRMYLTVRDVDALDVSGAGRLEADALVTDRLKLVLGGAGAIVVRSLSVDELEVELDGVGTIRVAGRARTQDVSLPGAGTYDAGELESTAATVRLTGVGQATTWVTETLDAQISGVGSLDYYGEPEVKVDRTDLGTVKAHGKRRG